MRAVSKIVRIPIRVRHQPIAKAMHRRRTRAEQALSDLSLTTRQRPLRALVQDFRNLALAIARGLVSKHRATPESGTVARSLILDAAVVATLPQKKDRPNEAISFNASIT